MAEQPPQVMNYGQPGPSSGMAVAAMVMGIISLVLFCIPYVSVPCAILAIVLGVVSRNRAVAGTGSGKGMATAGIICGVISIALIILLFAGVLAFLGIAGKHAPEFQKAIEDAAKKAQEQQMNKEPNSPSSMLEPLAVYARSWLM